MKKNKNCDKEYDKVQKLAHENRKMKKEINRLRHLLSKQVSNPNYNVEIEDSEEHSLESEIEKKEKEINKLKEIWKCHMCSEGFLEIAKYPKIGETWYYRKCSNPRCDHRTKSQKYTDNVKGILQGTIDESDKC